MAYVFGLALDLPANMAFSLLAVACSPGGGTSNMFSILLKGDLDMSITMTLFSTVGAIGKSLLVYVERTERAAN